LRPQVTLGLPLSFMNIQKSVFLLHNLSISYIFQYARRALSEKRNLYSQACIYMNLLHLLTPLFEFNLSLYAQFYEAIVFPSQARSLKPAFQHR